MVQQKEECGYVCFKLCLESQTVQKSVLSCSARICDPNERRRKSIKVNDSSLHSWLIFGAVSRVTSVNMWMEIKMSDGHSSSFCLREMRRRKKISAVEEKSDWRIGSEVQTKPNQTNTSSSSSSSFPWKVRQLPVEVWGSVLVHSVSCSQDLTNVTSPIDPAPAQTPVQQSLSVIYY